MSAGTRTLTVAPRFERSPPASTRRQTGTGARQRTAIRMGAFAALSTYGLVRWATLLHPVPTWRLLGLLALALAIAAGVPQLRRLGPPVAMLGAFVMSLTVFPIAGLPWQWFIHERITLSADAIGNGLQALAGVLVPYLGPRHDVRLVIVLGAGVLLLDAAIVMAFAPKAFGDARRAGAALPLIALAIVPSTLVHPGLPYLQGLLLFALLAAFMWGDRVRRDAAGAALVVAALAGVGAAIAAPRLDVHKPWVDYRAWAGTIVHPHLDAFDWNQTYGPLHWPHTGHEVLSVQAAHSDYWKAEDLDTFNGYDWEAGSVTTEPTLPAPTLASVRKWTQRIQVTIEGMRTYAVIGAGYSDKPRDAGYVVPGPSPGTWTSATQLDPGATYDVETYSPTPSPEQLRTAGNGYPQAELTGYRTLSIPYPHFTVGNLPAVVFPEFHSSRRPYVEQSEEVSDAPAMLRSSAYASAYALARRLAARASTPYGFVASVMSYLARGYAYNQDPPVRAYPLESFLFRDRIGYCQQFSGAMALLLRMGGLPARVATGFTSGVARGAHDWTVSDIDAHAWVEVWFPDYGWVRFDPTPAVAPARGGQAPLAVVKTLPGEDLSAGQAAHRELLASQVEPGSEPSPPGRRRQPAARRRCRGLVHAGRRAGAAG